MNETEAVERLGRVGVQSQCTVKCGWDSDTEVASRCVGYLVREIRESVPSSHASVVGLSSAASICFACPVPSPPRRSPGSGPTKCVAYAISKCQISLCEFVLTIDCHRTRARTRPPRLGTYVWQHRSDGHRGDTDHRRPGYMVGRLRPRTHGFGAPNTRLDGADNAIGNTVLQLENIFECAFKRNQPRRGPPSPPRSTAR